MDVFFVLANGEILVWRDHYSSADQAEEVASALHGRFNRPVSIVVGSLPRLNLPPLPWDDQIGAAGKSVTLPGFDAGDDLPTRQCGS